MIDEGEADWKIVTIDAEDKWAPFLNDIEDDIESHPRGASTAGFGALDGICIVLSLHCPCVLFQGH